MSSAALWLKCSVVIVLLAYFSMLFMRKMDDFYRQEFSRYLQNEKQKNPHIDLLEKGATKI
jgi:hypothetical protein